MKTEQGFNGDRYFTYITPAQGKRPSEYEEFTYGIQPEPKRFHWQQWPTRFPDGRASWVEDSTALRCQDWSKFRDPNKMWFRNYVSLQSDRVRQFERLVNSPSSQAMVKELHGTWLSPVLSHYLAASAFFEYGLFRSFSYAQREALSDFVGNAIVLNAADKVRYAQEIAVYEMELADAVPGYSDQAARSTWLGDPILQGAREIVERLMAAKDWAEIAIVANLVCEPLWGRLFREKLVLRFASYNGDVLTPVLVETAQSDAARNHDWSLALARLLVQDPQYSESNKQVLRRWLGAWLPLVSRACERVEPLFSLPDNRPLTFDRAFEDVKQAAINPLVELGVA